MEENTPQGKTRQSDHEASQDLPLLPARMVNEYEYCPRLAYLEWVQGEWADSADTVEGRFVHRRVDQQGGRLPEAEQVGAGEKIHARSVTLSSARLGVIARLDLIEADDGRVVPVDYKRGKRPHVPQGAYEPERVQLCVQGLILREHGYACEQGVLYYVGSRERVPVIFDDALIERTLSAVAGLRRTAGEGVMPPPLKDSPKCPRCSLVSICLPDETHFLRSPEVRPRPLAVGLDEALPLYVQTHNARISKDGETLEIKADDQTVARVRLNEVSQVVLQGNAYLTTPALHELMRREIPVVWMTYGGWFLGYTAGIGHKNVELRTAQYRAADDGEACLKLARGWVAAKIHNQRVLLRRNWRRDDPPQAALDALEHGIRAARRARSIDELLGIEGAAANVYFGNFSGLLREDPDGSHCRFDFAGRNRRPPTDPVNALLSFAYAMLARAWTVTLVTVGFDPYRGFYHQPRYGRPALALDLMEPFRPLVADSAVLQAINNGEVRPEDFVSAVGSVNLNTVGRKKFITAFERRLSHEITHPLFGYRINYRRLLELQARLLARHLLGELPENPNFTTR